MTLTLPVPTPPMSPLRRRLIEDMNMRQLRDRGDAAQLHSRRRSVRNLPGATLPDTAIAEDVRRFQVEQQ